MSNQVDKEVIAQKLTEWRQSLRSGAADLKSDFYAKPNPKRLFRQHCKLVDSILQDAWRTLGLNSDCTLIAVGGYGRAELYPHSDIDLLILLAPASNTDQLHTSNLFNSKIETLIGLIWDMGLHVGHSVRTLEECIFEAQKDITVQTNMMESRFLAGEKLHYLDFLQAMQNTLNVAEFIEGKLKEQEARHAKYNDTAYNLEPNIKESPGGLRDLHIIGWLVQSARLNDNTKTSTGTWRTLVNHHFITTQESRKIRHHEKQLQLLRIHLHFLSGRREDKLLFDFQSELAAMLGFSNTLHKRASEQLMQSYYRSVKFVRLMNEILLKLLQQTLLNTPDKIVAINAHFESNNNFLEAKTANLLQQQPTAIFEAFLLLQQYPHLKGMGARLLRNLQRVKHLVNHDFRKDPRNKKYFIAILSQPYGVNHALRAMNRYGILGSYIPAFGKVIGQMQHDLFHVYTVDEHILNVLANLRRFSKPELKHEFPLCSQLFAAFDAPHLLYLSALFHDIAKGRGGDHSTLGTVDAFKFCKQHDIPEPDTLLVSWLVEAHLKMSATAQKSDLSDPDVIQAFAQTVQTKRRLDALYLLTVADIRGTSPLVWNAWKARLLENLYQATASALQDPSFHAKQIINNRIKEASDKLSRFGINERSYEQLWQAFGDSYFTRHESEEIAWQSRLLMPHLHTLKPIVRARLGPHGEGIQIMIYLKDRDDLFARICNFFDRMGYSIVEAKIYTTNHGYALDSFVILDNSGKSVSYRLLLELIETELTSKLDKNHILESPLQGRISRQVRHMPIPTQVVITQHNDNHKLDIVANDRPGLLASLAQQFLKHGIALHNAKINTLGNRAEDTFLISAKNNQQLTESDIKSLQLALTHEL
ncbi:MAG: [protein-PII] uridylyltransferase [Betaproteobacteria bacterium HGW-Betaproteobacteria-22]|nr:MAG: [protein-PII] uridylyltransferase [Betaproteobacteria bacterium HGW-Betaproteobacteria-22]